MIQFEIPKLNLEITPDLATAVPGITAKVSEAADAIRLVFGDDADQYLFRWQRPIDDKTGHMIELDAQGENARSKIRLRYQDLSDQQQVRRKLLELHGNLLGQLSRISLAQLETLIAASRASEESVLTDGEQ